MAAPLRQTARGAKGDSCSSVPFVSTANGSVLPQDLFHEILVRLPVKPLCRLRAVCRSWQSLLSDSFFVATHGARHGPLVAALQREPAGIHILDTSGHTVRHISFENYPRILYGYVACTNLDLFCFIGTDKRPRVIDPATTAVSLLPNDSEFYHNSNFTSFVLGRASLTREAKVLAVTEKHTQASSCKILTLGVGGAGEWRETGCPPTSLLMFSRCVALVKGVLYFMGCTTYLCDHIAAYNLEKETWRPDLIHFPLPAKGADALAELSDSLVAVYERSGDQICPGNNNDIFMDLWFLTDSEKVLWSKRYTITMPYHGVPRPCHASTGYPLWALDDGKIVFWVSRCWKSGEARVVHLLRVYDPKTKTYMDGADMPDYTFVGVYKGSLLGGLP